MTIGSRSRDGLFEFFVAAVIAAGVLTIGSLAIFDNGPRVGPNPVAFAVLAGFLIVGELNPLKWLRRREGGEVTVSWTFAFALMLLASPFAALSALAFASLIGDLTKGKPPVRAAFNASQVTLSLAAGGAVLGLFGERAALLQANGPEFKWLIAVFCAGTTIFFLNGFFTCVVIALHQNVSPWSMLREGILLNFSIDGMLLALGPVFVVVARYSLLLLPLGLLTVWSVYRSAQLALARQHEATHDQLTGLPNRGFFRQQVDAAIAESDRRRQSFAVVVLDLDGFKQINDRFGHHLGDLVLSEIGERMASKVRPSDVVARLGGDEFALLFKPVPSEREACELAARILKTLREPVTVHGLPVALDSSVGVAVYPSHGEDFELLIRNADTAMYVAKRDGGGVKLFDGEQHWRSHGRMKLISDLAGAIERSELLIDYQPKVDIASGKIVGVEALTRWMHPKSGLIQPGDFIPLAEHTELIEPFTAHVLRRSLEQCAAWLRQGLEIQVAVNVSARNLHDVRFPSLVRSLLASTGVPSRLLEVELTENTVMEDPLRTVAVATELRAMGVQLAIDDFGTGFSSLATLRQLPVSAIKIDRSFVTSLGSDRDNAAIVRATVELAHTLGLSTIAEGVEDDDALQVLRGYGCDLAQGYLLGRPMAAGLIAGALKDRDDALSTLVVP